MDDPLTNDIIGFLERPIFLGNREWATDLTANANVDNFNFPSDFPQMYRDKMSGFYGIRATCTIKIQANSQPFQQGRLLVTYIPAFDELFATSQQRTDLIYNTLMSSTQLPRVELDLATDTEVSLAMPYITPVIFTNILTNEPTMGRFDIRVYSPLKVGSGANTVDLTYWLHLSDISLLYPTVAQSSTGLPKKKSRVSKTPAIRMAKAKSPAETELASEGLGPISSVAGVISNVAGALIPVPFLSSCATTVKWASDILGGVASAFGWSKPTNESAAPYAQLKTCQAMQLSDGVDNSSKLALVSTNSVATLPGFAGTDSDELDIRRVACQPAYYTTLEWAPADLGLLLSRSMNYSDYVEILPNGVRTCTPVSYVNNLFKYSRGSLDLTFKFVKTKFHSGRLILLFLPGVATAPASLVNIVDYTYKVVLDLRESNEFSVRLPYVNTVPYNNRLDYGCWGLYVLNNLVAASTVEQSIDIIVEVAAGPDAEFAVPFPICYPSIDYQGVQPGNVHQSALSESSDAPIMEIDGKSVSATVEPAMYSIGEKITSFRQLLKRFMPISSVRLPTVGAIGTEVCPRIITMFDDTDPDQEYDWLSYLTPMYLLHRGSIRVKAVNTFARSWKATLSSRDVPTNNAIVFTDTIAPGTAHMYNNQIITGSMEVELPHYFSTHSYLMPTSDGTLIPLGVLTNNNSIIITHENYPEEENPTTYYRAVGEDYSAGFFLGVPNQKFINP